MCMVHFSFLFFLLFALLYALPVAFMLYTLPVTLVNTLSLRVSEYLTTLNKHHEVVLGELNSRCSIEFLAPDKNGRTLQDRVLVSKDR